MCASPIPQQVVEHVVHGQQYALVDRAVALGWARDRVVLTRIKVTVARVW